MNLSEMTMRCVNFDFSVPRMKGTLIIEGLSGQLL